MRDPGGEHRVAVVPREAALERLGEPRGAARRARPAAGRRGRPRAAARGGSGSSPRWSATMMCASAASRSAARSSAASASTASASGVVRAASARAPSTRSTSWVVWLEPLDAHHERVAQARRQRAAAVEAGGEQLLGEQRVALAAGEQALDELVLRRRAEDVREQRRRAPSRVSGASSIRRAFGDALELGQQRAQRVAAVQLVGAVGRDDEHALGPQVAREERRGTRASSGRPSGCPRATAGAACSRPSALEQRTAAPRRRAAAPACSRSRAAARARRSGRRARAAAPRARPAPGPAARRSRGRPRAPASAARATSGA